MSDRDMSDRDMPDRHGPTWSTNPGSIRIEAIWRTLIRSLVLVQLALLIACLVVPILGADTDPHDPTDSDYGRELRTLTLPRAIGYYLTQPKRQFGSSTAHPYSVPGGTTLSIVFLVSLLVLSVLAVIATARLTSDRRGHLGTRLAMITGVGLILITALLALSQLWLGNEDFATPLQPGLLLPASAGGWMLSLRRGWLSWQDV